MNLQASPDATVLIDAHVHVYPAFDVRRLLDRASERMAAHAADHYVLALTDLPGVHGFQRLHRIGSAAETPSGEGSSGPWKLLPTQEASAIRLQSDRLTVTVIDGRQWRTINGLEVLGLGLNGPQVDVDLANREAMDVRALLDAVRDHGGVGVLPYGIGKWSGARGVEIADVIQEAPSAIVLGDNGNRLAGREPELLRTSRDRGIPVLPGTDPLPLPGHGCRVGRMMGRFNAPWQAETPIQSLRHAMEQRAAVELLGRGTAWPRLVVDQCLMQLRGKWSQLRGDQSVASSPTKPAAGGAVEVNA